MYKHQRLCIHIAQALKTSSGKRQKINNFIIKLWTIFILSYCYVLIECSRLQINSTVIFSFFFVHFVC